MKSRAFVLAPLQIAQAVIGFGAIAAFTRLMTPHDFGTYALALSASMFAHTLVFTWAEAATFRFFAASRTEGRLADHFATLLVLALGFAAAAFAITLALLFALNITGEAFTVALFVAAAAAFRFLTRLSRETDRAEGELSRYAFSEAIYISLGFALGIAALLTLDLGAAAPFLGLVLAGVIMIAIDAPRFLARAKGGVFTIRRVDAYARYGAPLALAIGVDLGVQALARVLLADQASAASLGAYAAAFGLARPVDLIFMWAGVALTPLILTAYEGRGAEAARTAAGDAFAALAAIAVPATIGLALIAGPLTQLMVGAALSEEAARALPWLAIAALLGGFNLYYWSEAFQLTRRTGVRAALMFAPGLLQLELTLALAHSFGAMGAAIASAAASAAATALLIGVGRMVMPLPLPLGALARIALASAAMAIVVLLTPTLAGKVLSGGFTYALAAIALDIVGARAHASAVWQRCLDKLRLSRPQPLDQHQ